MLAELQNLKDLFFEKLPIGDKTDEIKQYFSLLESSIYTNDGNLQHEEFPEPSSPSSRDRVYQYHSASYFKELESRHSQRASGQDVVAGQDQPPLVHATEDITPTTQDLAHVPDDSGNTNTDDPQPLSPGSHDLHDLPGELESRVFGELSDDVS